MDLGIGRGDTARRVLGKPPTTLADTEEAIRVIRALVEGEPIDYEGAEIDFPWTAGWTLPVWVAGYGPMALAMTGRVADGIILQLADPDLIRWFAARSTRRRSPPGRDPGSIGIQAAAPAHVGTRDLGRERTRWFPALVCNHVVDLVNRYPRDQLPEALTGYIGDREGYDYHHHAEVGSANAAFVGDEVVDRFCILGHGRRAHREAARARRGRRRPVQPVPDERRRGGPAGRLWPGRHPGPAGRRPEPMTSAAFGGAVPVRMASRVAARAASR